MSPCEPSCLSVPLGSCVSLSCESVGPVGASVNSASMSIRVCVSFPVIVLSGYMPSNRIAGSIIFPL